MNRRQFLMGSAAALIAAPAAVSADQWFIGFDASTGTDHSTVMVWRVHDKQIYVEDFNTDVLIEEYRRRWREKQAEIVEIWGSVGR